jgi:hypothetical protein
MCGSLILIGQIIEPVWAKCPLKNETSITTYGLLTTVNEDDSVLEDDAVSRDRNKPTYWP